MNATDHTTYIDAPPSRVHAALLDPRLLPRWRVPAGMRCHVHAFDARQGGAFRVSMTYEAPDDAVGKAGARTDTYHGWFARLVPNACVVERVAFMTADPRMQGEMRITTRPVPEGSGTRLPAVHEQLPPGVTPADNEAGRRDSLKKLAALLQPASRCGVAADVRAAERPRLRLGLV
jgi:uncharacterized protein YndB with AHSA1/START domain